MSEILQQLGLDQTFFFLFGLFAVLFLILSNVYFKPFLELFQVRKQRTVEDRQRAEKMLAEANAKLEEYKRRLNEERLGARQEYEKLLAEAKQEEAAILARAREEAKKITQEAAESARAQGQELRKTLEADVEQLATTLSDRLLARRD